MRHLATISEGRFERKPVHVECSCGVAGDFVSETEAHDWMEYQHFAKLTGIAYGEFFSAAPTPSEPVPAAESATEGQAEVPATEELKKNEAENEAQAPVQNETLGAS